MALAQPEAEARREGGGQPGHQETMLVGNVVELQDRFNPIADAGLVDHLRNEFGAGVGDDRRDRAVAHEHRAVALPRRLRPLPDGGERRLRCGLLSARRFEIALQVEGRGPRPGRPECQRPKSGMGTILALQDDQRGAAARLSQKATHALDVVPIEVGHVHHQHGSIPGRSRIGT